MLLLAAIVGIVALIFFSISKTLNPTSTTNNALKEFDCSQFMELDKHFPNQDHKLFKSLKTGVEASANGEPPEPTVFSLFSTDEDFLQKVMREVVKITMQCINQSEDPIELTKDHLGDKLIENYKQELVNRNIMIIKNVNEADPSTLPSLHSICDTENPLVPKSIIFLTMKVPKSPTGKPVEYLTNHLERRWRDLDDNVRGPLITRMTDQTFFLKP